MAELTNIKQEFLTTIKTIITQHGFKETVCCYEKISEHQTRGQVITINGQRMEQPGQLVTIKQLIYNQGDGWVSNEDESNKREFTQFKFETHQGDNIVLSHEDCFYWDEPQYFINIFNQIVK